MIQPQGQGANGDRLNRHRWCRDEPAWDTGRRGVGRSERSVQPEENSMAKRGNKRRARKKNKANHGKRPNA
ncbi:MAG: hypothetical protein ABI181_03495 [Mycobacteriaceae bacterium]